MRQGEIKLEKQGDVSIWGLWEILTEAIIDVRFGGADTDSWNPSIMDNCLPGWEKLNKDNNGKACYDQRRNWSQFLLSVGAMTGKEALVPLSTLSRVMAKKMDEIISHVTGWVNGRIAVAAARSYCRVLHRARSPSPLWNREQ